MHGRIQRTRWTANTLSGPPFSSKHLCLYFTVRAAYSHTKSLARRLLIRLIMIPLCTCILGFRSALQGVYVDLEYLHMAPFVSNIRQHYLNSTFPLCSLLDALCNVWLPRVSDYLSMARGMEADMRGIVSLFVNATSTIEGVKGDGLLDST